MQNFPENMCAKHKAIMQEEYLFLCNILDGIDQADAQMQNTGGGTKAIRMAIHARYAAYLWSGPDWKAWNVQGAMRCSKRAMTYTHAASVILGFRTQNLIQ